jgi:hypothetical protein
MSNFKVAEKIDPLGDLNDLSILPEIPMSKPNVELVIEKETKHDNVFYKKPQIKDIVIDDEIPDELESNIEDIKIKEEEPEKKKRGKRGKDTKPRKKRILSDAQKEALAKGRIKSAEVRRAKRDAKLESKKSKPVNIPEQKIAPPERFKPLDYNTFCSYMDQYSEKVKKKHSISKQPHPNKIINHQLRPQPPKSKPNIIKQPIIKEPEINQWTGSYHNFTQNRNTSQNNRWDFGL